MLTSVRSYVGLMQLKAAESLASLGQLDPYYGLAVPFPLGPLHGLESEYVLGTSRGRCLGPQNLESRISADPLKLQVSQVCFEFLSSVKLLS